MTSIYFLPVRSYLHMYSMSVKNKIKYHKLYFRGKHKGSQMSKSTNDWEASSNCLGGFQGHSLQQRKQTTGRYPDAVGAPTPSQPPAATTFPDSTPGGPGVEAGHGPGLPEQASVPGESL